jgi:hypothetical protein
MGQQGEGKGADMAVKFGKIGRGSWTAELTSAVASLKYRLGAYNSEDVKMRRDLGIAHPF